MTTTQLPIEQFIAPVDNGPLLAACQSLIDGASPYDGTDQHDANQGRYLVSAAQLQSLIKTINSPGVIGGLTVQNIDKGAFMADFNANLTRAHKMLKAAGRAGSIGVTAKLTLKSEGSGSFLLGVSGAININAGKLEKTEYFVEANAQGNELTLWSDSLMAGEAKPTKEKKPKKESAKKAGKVTISHIEGPDGFVNGAKVLVVLGTDGNAQDSVTGIVMGREDDGSYLIDCGNGSQKFGAQEVQAFHPETAA